MKSLIGDKATVGNQYQRDRSLIDTAAVAVGNPYLEQVFADAEIGR